MLLDTRLRCGLHSKQLISDCTDQAALHSHHRNYCGEKQDEQVTAATITRLRTVLSLPLYLGSSCAYRY